MIQNGEQQPGAAPGRFVQQGITPAEKEKRAVIQTAEQQSVADLSAARAAKITSEEQYHAAAQLLVAIKNGLKGWLELMEPIRETQHTAWKTTCATIKKVTDPWRQAEDLVIDEMAKWEVLRQERHKAEQEALNAQVQKEAEDHVITQAAALAEQGRPEVAEALLAQGPIVAPVVVPTPPRADGLTQVKRWTAQVTDLMALVREIAAGRQPLSFIEPNLPALNLQAKSLKTELRIPGVKAVEEISYARKAR